MDDLKTAPRSEISIQSFLDNIADPQIRKAAEQLCELMQKITGQPPVMWGSRIVGFDKYHYKYESGREGDMAAAGFSVTKANLTIYIVDGLSKYAELLSKLGSHKTGKACLYIKRMSDVNLNVLEELIRTSYQYIMLHKNNMHRAV